LGRPGVSVQVRHDPVPDPSAAGSGTRGGDVTGAAAASVSVGASGVTEVPGGGPGRGSNAGLASGCAGINQHPGVCATGPTRDSNTSASVGGGGSSSSVLGAAGATGGHIAAGSSIPAGQSGNIPSNHASGGGHHPPHGGFSTTGPAVIQLQFLINEGALVSATSDDSLHLWNIRQKRPDIVHTLKFQRERYVPLADQNKTKQNVLKSTAPFVSIADSPFLRDAIETDDIHARHSPCGLVDVTAPARALCVSLARGDAQTGKTQSGRRTRSLMNIGF
ncbi:Syntaxin-binding 5-like protein, partial [Daphnia magna]